MVSKSKFRYLFFFFEMKTQFGSIELRLPFVVLAVLTKLMLTILDILYRNRKKTTFSEIENDDCMIEREWTLNTMNSFVFMCGHCFNNSETVQHIHQLTWMFNNTIIQHSTAQLNNTNEKLDARYETVAKERKFTVSQCALHSACMHELNIVQSALCILAWSTDIMLRSIISKKKSKMVCDVWWTIPRN